MNALVFESNGLITTLKIMLGHTGAHVCTCARHKFTHYSYNNNNKDSHHTLRQNTYKCFLEAAITNKLTITITILLRVQLQLDNDNNHMPFFEGIIGMG